MTTSHKGFFWDAIVSILDQYAHYMRIATKNRCIYANTPELFSITCRYSLNVAVYQVDPCSSQQYVLIQEFVSVPMLPITPLCPFFSLRFAHSLSSLGVIFLVKCSSLEVFEQHFCWRFNVKVQLGPHAFMAWSSFPYIYAPPSSSN